MPLPSDIESILIECAEILCGAESDDTFGFICTLKPNHGDEWHIAEDENGIVIARWPNERSG